jgi:hypothetical protein
MRKYEEHLPAGWCWVTIEEEPGLSMPGTGLTYGEWCEKEARRLRRNGIDAKVIACGEKNVALIRRP